LGYSGGGGSWKNLLWILRGDCTTQETVLRCMCASLWPSPTDSYGERDWLPLWWNGPSLSPLQCTSSMTNTAILKPPRVGWVRGVEWAAGIQGNCRPVGGELSTGWRSRLKTATMGWGGKGHLWRVHELAPWRNSLQ
jgi:hypothetical protein